MTIGYANAKRGAVVRRSVKSGDIINLGLSKAHAGLGGFLQVLVPVPPMARVLPPDLPTAARERDRVLSITPRIDAQWGAAIGIAVTQIASSEIRVEGTPTRARRLKELLDNADIGVTNWTGGWVTFISKHVRDYLTTNNGAFFEIVRKSTARGSKIIGINHLSSIRCFRTGDIQYPVVYMDRWGRQHVLRWWEVASLSDMPDPDDILLGQGLCAAERAYQQIVKMAALERYVYEKVSGSRPLAIYIVSGLSGKQLKKVLDEGFEAQAQRGLTSYMGAVIASTLRPDEQPGLVTIPLAELPDGFNAEQERDRADLVYANSIGLDPQDLAPIGGERQLGVGSQSEVLHDKAKGRGLAAYRVGMTHMIGRMVADNLSRFYFHELDYVDQERKAKIARLRSDFVNGLVRNNILNDEQGRQILANWGEIPQAFVTRSVQAIESLTSGDKPDLKDAESEAQRETMGDMDEANEENMLQRAVDKISNAQAARASAQPQLSPGPARSGGEGTSTIPASRVAVR